MNKKKTNFNKKINKNMDKFKKSVTFVVNGFRVNEKTMKHLYKTGHINGDDIVTVYIGDREDHKLKVSDIYDLAKYKKS